MTTIRRLFSEFYHSTSLGFKLSLAFSIVIIVPMIILSYASERLVNAYLIKDTNEKINIGLRIAWDEYYKRGNQMKLGMSQTALSGHINHDLKSDNKKTLKELIIKWQMARPYLDLVTIVDKDGHVIVRLNSDFSGDTLEINGLVSKAIKLNEQQMSSEIIPEETLKREGEEFIRKHVFVYKAPGMAGNNHTGQTNIMEIEKRALALVVVTPVPDGKRNIIGAIITADILNNDRYLADYMLNNMPGLAATIAMDGKRIATGLTDDKGQNATGTMLAGTLISEIKAGKVLRVEWNMLGKDYISAFEPIINHKGDVIGSLDVSIPKSLVLAPQRKNRMLIGLITALGLVFGLTSAFLLTYRVTRPLKQMKEKARAFAGGDLKARVRTRAGEDSRDEASVLAITFNKMVEELVQKGAEKEEYLSHLEEKNKELKVLNEKLTNIKGELEISFEEIQSQSEEVQSTNEELRLTNEELEKKNTEIVEAYRTIKNDEEELIKARDKLRLIYNTVKDYILLTDKELTVLEANHSFAKSLRTKESYVIGRILCHLFGIKDPADCPARSLTISDDIADSDAICLDPSSNCPVKRSLRSGSPVSLEMNVGSRILEWHSYPLSEETLFPETAVVYIRDITEQKALMHRLVQSDKLSSIGELVSGVAHELNNPLTSIMGFSELLLMDNINEASKKKAETIHESSLRCKRIVDNLLSFSRSHKPEKTYQDINSLITGILDLKAYRLDVEDIETRLDLDETIPMIMADGHQLQQVFLNLLNNAEHALQEKGGQGTITIRTGYRNNKLFITFTDSGSGIPERTIPRIFDPFFTTKEVGKGTGLGLSISYGIIKEHGGDIQVMSKQGSGTSFLIELPVVTSADKPVMTISEHVREETQIVSGGLRALLLDDEPLILDFVKEVLLDSGYSVDAVSEGQKALELLGNSDYDIIISDMKMPGMSGKQFYLEAKKLRPRTSGKIIFMSGDTASKETQDFLKETGNQYVQKPFTVQMLKEVISKVLR